MKTKREYKCDCCGRIKLSNRGVPRGWERLSSMDGTGNSIDYCGQCFDEITEQLADSQRGRLGDLAREELGYTNS